MSRPRIAANVSFWLSLTFFLSCGPPGLAGETPAPSIMPGSVSEQGMLHPEGAAPHTIGPELQGDILMARRQYAAAIAKYQEAPLDSAVIWNKIGIGYHHLFALPEAKKDYEKALSLNPHYPEALNNLGAVYYGERQYKHAEHLYKKALKLSPRSALLWSNLGTAYFSEKKYAKGAKAFEQAFALDPNVFDPDAAARIEEATATHDMARMNYSLAKTYAQAGMQDRALAYLRKALSEGFDDRKKLMEDKELASLRTTQEFKVLIAQALPQ